MSVLKITSKNFEQEVVYAEKTVLIEFWASWAGQCKKLSPVVDEVAALCGDQVTVGRVNVDEEMDIAAQFHAFRIPMLAVVKDGQITDTVVGARSKEVILEMLK